MADDQVKQLRRAFAEAEAKGDMEAMRQIAQAFKQYEDTTKQGYVEGLARQAIGQGAAFGFGDEIEARARALFSDRSYEDIRDEVRAKNEAFQEDNPLTSLAAQIVGGAVTGGWGLGRSAVRAGIGRMTAMGAAEGALAGAGAAQELGDVPLSAAGGAVLGAGVAGLGAGAERVLSGRANRELTGRAKQAMQGMTPEQVGARMADIGPEATAADTSRGMLELAGVATRSVPENQEQYIRQLATRQEGAPDRIAAALREETGTRMSRGQASETVKALREAEAIRNYGPLAGQRMQPSEASLAILEDSRAGRRAANAALERINMKRLADDEAPIGMEDAQGMFEFWHAVQIELREAADKAGIATSPLSRSYGHDVRGLRDKVVADMNSQPWGPQYELATAAYRTRSDLLKAIDSADDFRKIDMDELRGLVADFTPQERAAMTTTVVSDMIDKVMGGPSTAGLARDIIKSAGMRKRLKILVGEDAADAIVKRLSDEEMMRVTYNEIAAQGSRTAGRQAADEVFGALPMGSEIGAELATGGGVGSVIGGVARSVLGGNRRADPAVSQKILQDVMMPTDPAQVTRALQELQMANKFRLAPQVLGGGIIGAQGLNPLTGQGR